MGISFSLVLIAVGAVLIWAVDATVSGLNIHVVGVILLIVGLIGFVTSFFFLSSWGGFGARTPGAAHTTVVTEHTEPQA